MDSQCREAFNGLDAAVRRFVGADQLVMACQDNQQWPGVMREFHLADRELRAACRAYVQAVPTASEITA